MDEEFRRMRWASRRGMLELDLVLGPFMDEHYNALSARERQQFEELMRCEDQELFGWFLGREKPDDANHAEIVKTILAFHHRG